MEKVKLFDKQGFNDFIIDTAGINISSEPAFQLKSGKMSHFYLNLRNLSSSTKLIDQAAGWVIKFVTDLIDDEKDLSYFYGVPHGATKLALHISSSSQAEKLVMGRGEMKEHGDPADRIVIGPMEKTDNIIVLEDVTTTGGSIASEIYRLELVKPNIIFAMTLLDRSCGDAKDVMDNINVKFHAMTDVESLLERFKERNGDFNNAVSKSLEEIKNGRKTTD